MVEKMISLLKVKGADDFIVKELEFQGSNRSYDQIVAVGESVTEHPYNVVYLRGQTELCLWIEKNTQDRYMSR